MSTADANAPELTEDERAAIDAILAEHEGDAKAAGIGALKSVQEARGFVSDAALAAVARHLGLDPAELDAVATFYNLIFRAPVGRHVILVCDSVSCWIMGADAVTSSLSDALGIAMGETTADGRFTLLPTVCLGDCDHAPVAMVGRDMLRELDPAGAAEAVERYR